jgi:hypothetical protein
VTSTSTDRRFGVNSSAAIKVPVKAASTGPLTLSGEQTVDGVALVDGDRVLVKDQASGVNNGIYVVDTGTWERAPDFQGPYNAKRGTLVKVNSGSVSAGLFYEVTTSDPITIGTTSLAFAVVSPSSSITIPLPTNQGGTGGGSAISGLANLGVIQVTAEGGTANAQTGTIDALVTAFRADQIFIFTPSITNTGATQITLTPSGGSALVALNVFVEGAALIGEELKIGVPTLLQYDGTQLNIISAVRILNEHVVEGRLTLTSGTAVTTSDVTGSSAEALYFTPFNGNRIDLYDSTALRWKRYTFTERSIDIPDATSMYDVFIYDNAGTITLDLTAWTNDTTRATALTTQDGVLVKTGATNRRYLGSIYATTAGNGQSEDSVANRFLWNYYNREPRVLRAVDTTDSWEYQTNTYREANGVTTNRLNFIIGVAEKPVRAEVTASASSDQTVGLVRMYVGIGVDSTTVNSAQTISNGLNNGANFVHELRAVYQGHPGIGKHFLARLEKSTAAGTTTWYGDASDAGVQSSISGEILA